MTAPSGARVVDSAHEVARIDYADAKGQRAVPYHCPFCAEEDLRPHAGAHGAWHCRSCLRVFAVRFLGLDAPDTLDAPDAPDVPDAADALEEARR